MSQAWKQEYRMASEADQIDWSALLHAFARPENAAAPSHGPLASQGLSLFSLTEDASALSPQAVAFEWLDQLLDLQLPAPFAFLADGQSSLPGAVAELPSAAGDVPSQAGEHGPLSLEPTAETMALLEAFLPEVRGMVQEAITKGFSGPPPLASVGFLIPDVPTLTPPSDFPI